MNNYEKELTKLLCDRKATVNDVKAVLIKMAENTKLRVNKKGFENLKEDLQALCSNRELPEKYRGQTENIDIEKIAKFVYHSLTMLEQNIGKFAKDEDTTGYNEDRTCWLRVDSQENSSVSIYTVSNAIELLEKLEAIKKVRSAKWVYKNYHGNLCTRYEFLDKAIVRYLEVGDEFVNLTTPQKLITKYVTRIERAKDYEICVMASILATTVDNLTYQKACQRLNAHRVHTFKNIPNTSRDNEGFKEQEKADDKKFGIDVINARIVKNLFEFDITTIASVHHDTYGGRLYHKWSTVKKETRERAILRGELDKYGLVEIDLSQCNFFILYSLFCEETDIIPTKLLSTAVSKGKLREVIAIAAKGVYEDVICDTEICINFDEITNFRIAKKYKEQLKLFFLKASNCRFGAEAGHIMDEALAKIDANFARWIRHYRRGFTVFANWASGKQSAVPYMTQQNEVEFMYGYKMNHTLPNKGTLIKDTEYSFNRTKKGLVDFLIEHGVKYFLPIHDAIIVTEDCAEDVIVSLFQTAELRNYGIPACKVIDYKTGGEIRINGQVNDIATYSTIKMSLTGYNENTDKETKAAFIRLNNCYKSLMNM